MMSALTTEQRRKISVENAATTIAGLTTDGGSLRPSDGDRFYKQMIEKSTVLSKIQTVRMDRETQRLPRLGFTGTLARPINYDAEANPTPWVGRELPFAGQAAPNIASSTLTAKGFKIVVPLYYEVLEDNIEREGFTDVVLGALAERVPADVEYIGFQGDTDAVSYPSFDTTKAMNVTNGWLKKVPVGNSVALSGGSATTFNFERIQQLSTLLGSQYKMDRKKVGIFISPLQEDFYRTSLYNQGTDGAQFMSLMGGTQPLPASGYELIVTPYIPDNQVLMTPLNNLIMGVRRDVTLRYDDEPMLDAVLMILTMRLDFALLDPDGAVRLTGLATS